MKLSKLLLTIGIVIIAFWVVSFIFKVTFALLHFLLVIGVILIIASLVQDYFQNRRS